MQEYSGVLHTAGLGELLNAAPADARMAEVLRARVPLDEPIIFVTGYGDVPMSVTAVKAGAVDFLTKPLGADALIEAVQRALSQYQPRSKSASDDEAIVDGIVGTSQSLRALLQQVKPGEALEA